MSDERYNIDEIIAAWLSGEIDEDRKSFLSQWIDSSEENKIYIRHMLNIWQAAHPAFSPDSIDSEAAEAKVMNEIDKRRKFHPHKIFIWWSRIAALVVFPLLFACIWLLWFQKIPTSSSLAYQEISSPFGMHSQVTLPDGSLVWLNSGSRLKYAVPFEGKERKVNLDGEAFFKVRSDKLHPFIVETEYLDIKATGTRFNVEAYGGDSLVSVVLEKGIVNVMIEKQKDLGLLPDQRIKYNPKNRKYNISNVDAKEWGLWRCGILAFRDRPLGEVFRRVGRTFNVDIELEDHAIAGQLYRATFENESMDEILRLLKLTVPIRYRITERRKLADGTYSREKIEVLAVH